MLGIGQRVAGEALLEADGRGDVARVDLLDLLAVVGVHLQDAADALLAVLRGVVHVRARLEGPRVHAEERELADERVGRDLERERAEGLLVVRGAQDFDVCPRVLADDRRDVEGRGQEVHDRVEHRLDALVLQSGAGEDRHDLVLEGRRGGARAGSPARSAPRPRGTCASARRRLSATASTSASRCFFASAASSAGMSTTSIVLPRSSRYRIACIRIRSMTPLKFSSDPIGIWIGTALAPRRSLIIADAAPEVGAGPVELVDEADPRHAVAVGLAPDRLGLGLDAGDAVEDDDRAIEHAKAALDLDGEVHVPGRIDDVDAMIVPEAGRSSRGDRDPALLLLGHPVHGGRALMDLTELVDLLRVEEDPLGDGGLARIDMGDDSDVPRLRERNLTCHGCFVTPEICLSSLARLLPLARERYLCLRRLAAPDVGTLAG